MVDRYIQPQPTRRQTIAQQMPRGDAFEVSEVGLLAALPAMRSMAESDI